MDKFRFEEFVLESRKRVLLRGPEIVPIGARAFDLLEALLVHRDRVVSRNEIMQALVPDTVLGDNNLNV